MLKYLSLLLEEFAASLSMEVFKIHVCEMVTSLMQGRVS